MQFVLLVTYLVPFTMLNSSQSTPSTQPSAKRSIDPLTVRFWQQNRQTFLVRLLKEKYSMARLNDMNVSGKQRCNRTLCLLWEGRLLTIWYSFKRNTRAHNIYTSSNRQPHVMYYRPFYLLPAWDKTAVKLWLEFFTRTNWRQIYT
jgi:hypothetical protein